jgi:cellulose synthase/poly-beta-1,6-N-acetylglucosamine synthase-like glycosyltransferase
MKRYALRSWRLSIDENYRPSVCILVPVHNEEKIIQLKLRNLLRTTYPRDKVEVLLVNDASTDNSLGEINEFLSSNRDLNMRVINRTERSGKTNALNYALKQTMADVIVVSDADCFWPSDILERAMPYLSSSDVGAVAGFELLLNEQDSWVTKGELLFDNIVHVIRLGESKAYATINLQGGFAAYKRKVLGQFDVECDDCGTALNIIQKNNRTLLLPEARFYTVFPDHWRSKITLKIRRASQLQHLWAKCLRSLLRGRNIVLPKRIALPEIFLYLFNPIIFAVLIPLSILLVIEQPYFLLVFLVLFPVLLIAKSRESFIETMQNNSILLAAMASSITNRKFGTWKPMQESRLLLNERVLKDKQLI